MTVTLQFDPIKYQETLRLAGNAWRNADGKADDFARNALAALVNDDLSPLALAITVYDEMKPTTAKGSLAEPKESERAAGGVSVSSLRSARGGEGARSCLDAIFYISDNRKAERTFGWQPRRHLRQIASDLHEWLLREGAAVRTALAR